MSTGGATINEGALIKILLGSLLAIALVGLITAYCVWSIDDRRLDRQRFLAHLACRNALESIRSFDPEALIVLEGRGFDVPTWDGLPGGLPVLPGDKDGLAGRFTVRTASATRDQTLYRITVTVEWGSHRYPHSYEITSLITSRTGA